MTTIEPAGEARGKAIIFDGDKDWAEAAKEILRKRNIIADIETKVFQECYRIAEEAVYVVAIINVHSLENPRMQLVNFSNRFPAIGILIVEEKYDPDITASFLWPPNPVADYNFGRKGDLPLTKLGYLTEEIIKARGMLPGNIDIKLSKEVDKFLDHYTQSWSGAAKKRGRMSLKVMRDELKIIIGRLFSQPKGGQPIAREISVKPYEESGKSVSCMFNITPKIILDETHRKSAVLKFGPKDETKIEADNYDKFVEWFLTVDQAVRKIGYEEGNNFGGILYSYPRDVAVGYESFADYIRKNDQKSCAAIIEQMFNVNNKNWLSVDGNKFVDRDTAVFQTYYVEHVLHAGLYEMRETHFKKLLKEINNLEKKTHQDIWTVTEDKITFPPLSIAVPNAISYLSKPLIDEIKLTVIHGDLHAHNILIDDKKRHFFIDFFYTGFGDIYRDFIELELSVRYDLFSSRELPPEKRLTAPDCNSTNTSGLKKLIRLEKALIAATIFQKPLKDSITINDDDFYKAFRIISEIRRFAFENYAEKKRLYYMGLVFSSLKALKYFYPLDIKIYHLIISGLYIQLLEKGDIS